MRRILLSVGFLLQLIQLKAQVPIVTVKTDTVVVSAFIGSEGYTHVNIPVTIFYNGAGVKKPYTFHLTTANSSSPAIVANGQTLASSTLAASTVKPEIRSQSHTVALRLNAIKSLTHSESVDIVRRNGGADQSRLRVVITPPKSVVLKPANTFTLHLVQILPDTLPPLVQPHEATATRQTRIVVAGTGTLDSDTRFPLEMLEQKGNQTTVMLLTTHITVPAAKTTGGTYRDTIPVQFRISSIQQPVGYEPFDIKAKDDLTRQVVYVGSKDTSQPQKTFWVEIGANFDLLEKLRPNNLFVGVFFYKRDVGRFSLRNRSTRNPANRTLAMLGGIYQSKSVGSQTVSDLPERFSDVRSLYPDAQQRYIVFVDTGTSKLNVSVNTLSLFFSPQVRLTRKQGNADGLHLFAPLWCEFLWQRTESRYDYSGRSLFRTDTVRLESLRLYPQRRTSQNQDFRSVFFGSGLSGYLKEGNANLYVQSIIGFTNQRFGIPTTSRTVVTRRGEETPTPVVRVTSGWKPFFLTTFRLSEEKFGFAFTGELRGMLESGIKPVFSLALSKKLNLSKLVEFTGN